MSNDFGFEAVNDDSSVLVSTQNRPLVFSFRGQMEVRNNSVVDRPSAGAVVFPAPVRTKAPPRIFIRLNSSRHSSLTCYVFLSGSINNWTGFTVVGSAQGGGALPLYVLDYVICIPSGSTPVFGEWGFALFDEQGNPIFNNLDRVVQFGKFTKKWQYTQSFTPQRVKFHNFLSNITIDADDYIDITYFNRGTVFMQTMRTMYTSLELYRNSTRVFNLVVQDSTDTDVVEGVADLNHCVAVCKFPATRYQ